MPAPAPAALAPDAAATPRPARPSTARVLAALAGVGAVAAALTAAGRALAPLQGALPAAASVACGAAAMLLVSSIAEWLVHGGLMHRRSRLPLLRLAYDLHHRAHHWVHYPPDRYLRAEVTYVPLVPHAPERVCRTRLETAVAAAGQAAFYALFAAPPLALAWLATGGPAFTLAAACVAGAFIVLAVHVHGAVHCPGASPLERFAWFRALDRHHHVHHIDTRANVNFLCPLVDALAGTLRREADLTAPERARWPSYAEARATIYPPEG